MLTLILIFSIFHISYCACPSGFELISDGLCQGKYGESITMYRDEGYTNVVAKCNEIHAQPIIIHNEEQQAYWANWKITHGDTGNYYSTIGLTCNTSNNKWEWADGSALDFKPSNTYGITDWNQRCKTGCTWVISDNKEEWQLLTGHSTWGPSNIMCTKQLKQMVPDEDSCERFEDDIEDGACYEVGATAESWQDAQMICKKMGANLASIHNLQENSFLRRLAVSKGAVNGLFLGATISGKGGNFGWIDGSTWDYENFAFGFPREGFGDCIAMDTSTSAGQWMNIDCSAKFPVACIRDRITITAPNATCSAQTWMQEGEIITSPGFPFTAATPCDFYLEVDPGKRVEAEITLLEANSCCDYLIIYDGYLGAPILANLTGSLTNVTYTTSSSNIMRVSWIPNGGVNVLGLAMTFFGV